VGVQFSAEFVDAQFLHPGESTNGGTLGTILSAHTESDQLAFVELPNRLFPAYEATPLTGH
jgi:hypothetical protein